MDLGLPFSSGFNVTEMYQVDQLRMMVKQEDIKEEYCHIAAFQHDEEKPFAELHCRTDIETDVAESSGTETQQTTAVTLKKEEDENKFNYLLRNPVSLAQMNRVSVVLVDCCRTQGRRGEEEEMQTQTNGDAHHIETNPVSLAQMKRVSVVLVDCCRPQGQRRKEEIQMETKRDVHQIETNTTEQKILGQHDELDLQLKGRLHHCTVCRRSFTTLRELEKHQQTHSY
ncbi:hypothetical protein AALO_G00091370 [Alosa alosa]|uniref:C2H2-type domain-containing protein n=1 Tax=Alosa alosa TaxID=278164 RepID=A0AAV6GVD5_9TELE|nr:hypothetical protein AALO_G00091370 [Alosa alosa]